MNRLCFPTSSGRGAINTDKLLAVRTDDETRQVTVFLGDTATEVNFVFTEEQYKTTVEWFKKEIL